MGKLFITRENLGILIRNLKNECDEFIAPRLEHLDDIILGDTKTDNAELLNYSGNTIISPRAFLLPQTEPLFKIKSVQRSKFIPIEDKKRRIFYAVRPCDMKALMLMRSFFLEEFVDVFYKQKLDNSIFICLACNERCSDKSFCYEMDAGPRAKDGFDLQLISVDKGFLIDIGSAKGVRLVKQNKKLFTKPTDRAEKEARTALKDFTQGIKKLNYRKIANAMKQEKIKEYIWDDIGLRCVVCSGCITLCPTCSCFSITDRLNADTGIRLRYCDGCPYAGFTKMAGANTVFPQHKDHIRRFFEHKLNIDVERYGRSSCVGCARCIQTCPGNISIRKFMDEVLKV